MISNLLLLSSAPIILRLSLVLQSWGTHHAKPPPVTVVPQSSSQRGQVDPHSITKAGSHSRERCAWNQVHEDSFKNLEDREVLSKATIRLYL